MLQNKDSRDWEEWAENVASVAAPLLAERGVTGELCALLARLCRRRPRAAPLPALAPPVRRVLTRNVDFGKAPHARQFVRDYIRLFHIAIFSFSPRDAICGIERETLFRIQQGRLKKPIAKTLRSPLSVNFSRHCNLLFN